MLRSDRHTGRPIRRLCWAKIATLLCLAACVEPHTGDAAAADVAAATDVGHGADSARIDIGHGADSVRIDIGHGVDSARSDAGPVADATHFDLDAGHVEDSASVDGGHRDAPGGDAALLNFGFTVRVPQARQVDIGGLVASVWDADRVCTLVYQQIDGHTYVQLTPTATMAGKNQRYRVDGAWVSADEQVTAVTGYYMAGNHWATSMEVVYDGQRFRYYHSSFLDVYGTPCHDYDCLQVWDVAGATLIENGCTAERTLPIVCVHVAHDGTVPPLVDTFAPCVP